jgi:dihydrolipoamide dehydrogenase
MSDMQFDVVFIGAGPGGYVGAIRAAQLGLKTAIIEKDKTFGGTCLNVGCIPSKALLESSEHYAATQHDLGKHGIEASGVKLNLGTLLERKDKIVKDLTQGIAFLMKKNKITTFNGLGKVVGPNQVEVTMANGLKPVVTTKNIVLATGSSPIELPFLKFDEKRVVSSTGALSLSSVPKRMAIIGAGVIGLEMGSVWSRLGAEVTFIEFADKIGGMMDGSSMTMFQKILQKQGFKFLLKTKVVGADISDKEIVIKYESGTENSTSLAADVVLVAVGRRPFTEGLGLQDLGIETDKGGRVIVNHHYQTGKFANIYAIGDIIQGPMLAHKAEEEGVAVAEIIAGQAGHVNYNTVPGVIYTWPEVASVGMTEEQLKEKNIPYNSGTFPFVANGRAKALGYTEGQAKVLAHATTDKILGVHIVGPKASELIGEAVVAMEFGGSAEDLARSFHAHPTLSEVVREAALNVDKRARQM